MNSWCIAILTVWFASWSGQPSSSRLENKFVQEGVVHVIERASIIPGEQSTCGIYAMCAAISACGLDVDPLNYLRAEYFSVKGSTLEQLTKLGQDCGATCATYRHLTFSGLLICDGPVVLLTKIPGGLITSGHWVTYLGTETDGRVRIFNSESQEKVVLMHPAELLAIWDGVAISVSSGSIWPSSLWVRAYMLETFASLTALTLVLIRTAARLLRQRSYEMPVVVVAVVCGVGFAWFDRSHVCHPTNQDFLRWQVSLQGQQPIREITLEDFQRHIARDELVVDARLAVDYSKVHLRGAMNFPPDLSYSEFENETRNLSKNRPIVIYCHSMHCDYAVILAKRFSSQGFTEVAVFAPGLLAMRDHGFELVHEELK